MTSKTLNFQIAEEAADWAVRVDASKLSPAEQQDLADWLRASPIHLDEFLLASAMFSGLSAVESAAEIDIDALLEKASAEIVPLVPSSPGDTPEPNPPPPRRAMFGYVVGALASLAAAAAMGFFVWFDDPPPSAPNLADIIYQTDLGEQRSVQLKDGTLVHINTQSVLHVSYEPAERRVELVQGEAMFDVKPDPDRPFRVAAGTTIAEALGTVFNVRLSDTAAIVSVVEGTVKVDQRRATPAPEEAPIADPHSVSDPNATRTDENVILTVGDRASILPSDSVVSIDQQSIEAITSWRSRKLVFEGDRLDFIASEFNRYNRTQLVVIDADLASERFTGVFDADDPESFVKFLDFAGGVAVHERDGEIRLGASPR